MSGNEFAWRRWPETERFLEDRYAEMISEDLWFKEFVDQLLRVSGTLIGDWVDHLLINGGRVSHETLRELGYKPRRGEDSLPGKRVYVHTGADFPVLIVDPNAGSNQPILQGLALRVESVPTFLASHQKDVPIQGYPMGPYRVARWSNGSMEFAVVERRGYRGFETFPSTLAREGQMTPQRARNILEAKELWLTRVRCWGPDQEEQGFEHADTRVRRMIDLVGRDLACELVFEVEREYWQARNKAAQTQKLRQDRIGLGWANHDHHTFRCSRRNFHRLISVLELLGFQLRERFHAGEHAGWGAQVLEHPVTGIVVFADLDLKPDEIETDFAHQSLEPLARPNTVGLWVALHGESFLNAGMHHLEAQFDFESAVSGLLSDAQIKTMKPFSDFPFLRQAFTQGETWQVEPVRVEHALKQGWINADDAEKFVTNGAIGSHLEILQRREGYKGFNQQAVSAILGETDPRKVILG